MTDVSSPASPLRVTAQVHLAADPHQVWDLVTDWSRQHEWIWATQVRGGRAWAPRWSAGPGWARSASPTPW